MTSYIYLKATDCTSLFLSRPNCIPSCDSLRLLLSLKKNQFHLLNCLGNPAPAAKMGSKAKKALLAFIEDIPDEKLIGFADPKPTYTVFSDADYRLDVQNAGDQSPTRQGHPKI